MPSLTFTTPSDHEAFVRIWERASSIAEVAEKTGLSPLACSERAKRYRRRGVKLRLFNAASAGARRGKRRGGNKGGRPKVIDVERLNRLAESVRAEAGRHTKREQDGEGHK